MEAAMSNVFSGESGGPGYFCDLYFISVAQHLYDVHELMDYHSIFYISVQAGVGIFFQQEADGSVYVKTIVSNGSAERDGVAQVHRPEKSIYVLLPFVIMVT